MKSNQNKTINDTTAIIKIEAKVNKTENIKKVITSIKNITTDEITVNKTDDDRVYTQGDINLLKTIQKHIKTNNLEELTQQILNKNRTEDTLEFYINKQSAYHNNIHLIDESMAPLGDIHVIIKTGNLDDIINWIIN